MLLGQQNIRGNQLSSARTTVGTYVGSDGLLHTAQPHVLRPNYVLQNGVWVQQGFLREAAATNLVIDSIATPDLSGGATIAQSNRPDPMGGNNANFVWSQAGSVIFTGPEIKSGTYAASLFVMNTGGGVSYNAQIYIGSTNVGTLSTTCNGAEPLGISFTPSAGFSGGLIDLGDGSVGSWKRAWVSGQFPDGDGSWIQTTDIKYRPAIISAFGYQIELGDAPTSFIPTTNGPVTRTAD